MSELSLRFIGNGEATLVTSAGFAVCCGAGSCVVGLPGAPSQSLICAWAPSVTLWVSAASGFAASVGKPPSASVANGGTAAADGSSCSIFAEAMVMVLRSPIGRTAVAHGEGAAGGAAGGGSGAGLCSSELNSPASAKRAGREASSWDMKFWSEKGPRVLHASSAGASAPLGAQSENTNVAMRLYCRGCKIAARKSNGCTHLELCHHCGGIANRHDATLRWRLVGQLQVYGGPCYSAPSQVYVEDKTISIVRCASVAVR